MQIFTQTVHYDFKTAAACCDSAVTCIAQFISLESITVASPSRICRTTANLSQTWDLCTFCQRTSTLAQFLGQSQIGDRNFSEAGLWNSLPVELRERDVAALDSLSDCRRLTYLLTYSLTYMNKLLTECTFYAHKGKHDTTCKNLTFLWV